MIRVLDRLMLSDLSEANDPFFLQLHKVQAVLYFGDGGMFSDEYYLYHRPTQRDGTLAQEQVQDGVEFIRESMRAGRRVLAVGGTGATIVAAYLMEMGMSSDQALDMIARDRTAKADAEALEEHHAELRRRSSVTVGHRLA